MKLRKREMWGNAKLRNNGICRGNAKRRNYGIYRENDLGNKPRRIGKICGLDYLCVVSILMIGGILLLWNMQAKAGDELSQVELKCEVSGNEIVLGKFQVQKEWKDGEVLLHGSIVENEESERRIDDYEISWSWKENGEILKEIAEQTRDRFAEDEEIDTSRGETKAEEDRQGEKELGTGELLPVSINGIYTALLHWQCLEECGEEKIEIVVADVPKRISLKDELLDENYFYECDKNMETTVSINQIPEKEGMIFRGYEQDNILLITECGKVTENFIALWKSGHLKEELTARWEPKKYRVYYGKDEDKDGMPDSMLEVIYGQSFENVSPMPDRGLSVFRGFYFDKAQVIDRDGKSKGVWIWDGPEEIVLKAKYYRPAGSDLISSGEESSKENIEAAEKEKKQSGKVSVEEESNSQVQEDGNILPQPENNENAVNGEEMTQNKQTEPPRNNMTRKNNAGEKIENVPENPGGTSAEEQNSMEISSIGPVHISQQNMENTTINEPDKFAEISVSKNVAEEQLVVQEEMPIEEISIEEMQNQEIAKKVGKITAMVLVSSLALASFILSIYLLWNSVVLYTLDENGKRVRIVYILINQRNYGYQIRINQRQLEASLTGEYLIWIPRWFCIVHRNENITIELPAKKWTTIVQKEISFVA